MITQNGELKGVEQMNNISVGTKFGKWTVLISGNYKVHDKVPCQCECGKERYIESKQLKEGKSSSCLSCSKIGLVKRKTLPHLCREDYNKLYETVCNAIKRCTDKNNIQYPDYGGRGITVYQEWLDDKFKFMEYLYTLEGCLDVNLRLDREDNDKGYEPGNLRYVTPTVSSYNRRPFGHKLISYGGKFRRKSNEGVL